MATSWRALLLLPATVSLLGLPALAASTVFSQGFHYQGRLLSSDGAAPMGGVVDLTLGIYSSDGACLLYEEKVSGIDLDETQGFFSVMVGSASGDPKRTARDPGKTLAVILANGAQVRADHSTCPGGYTPGSGESRRLRVTVQPQGGVAETLSPDLTISPAPQSFVAETLQGLLPDSFIQAKTTVTQTALGTLTAGASSDASSLHNHDGQYAKLSGSSSLSLGSGQVLGLGSNNGTPAGVQAGDTWFDSADNKVKYWDGTQAVAVGSGTGGVSSFNTRTGAVTLSSSDVTTALGFTPANSSTMTTALSGKEPTLAAGAETQYYRGDKSWQTLNTDAVPEGATNKYFTGANAKALLSGTLPVEYSSVSGAINIKGLSGLGAGDQLLGMKGDGAQVEYKTLSGTAKRVSVTHGAGTITLSGPQDLDTAATPTFGGMTLTGALTLPGDPTLALQACTKQYVDSVASNASVIGKVLTGLSTASGGAVAATDTIVQAFGKLENRMAVNDAKSGFTQALARGSVSAASPLAYDSGTGQFTIGAASGTAAGSMSSAHYSDLANATSSATNSTLVKRDPSGNFSAGTITANLTGNVSGTAANVTGTVAIANGGTGATTAGAAFTALAPSQTGNSGKFLTTNGTSASWDAVSEGGLSFSDVTMGNATTAQHGLLPKLGGGTANFLRADGTWAAPAAGADLTTATSFGTSAASAVTLGKAGINTVINGAVGIGTTAPASKFDIRGSSAKATTAVLETVMQVGSTDASGPLALRMGVKTDATATSRYGAIEVDDDGTKRNLVLQPSGGNVGIGAPSAGWKFYVTGDVAIDGVYRSTSDLILAGGSGWTGIGRAGMDNVLYVRNAAGTNTVVVHSNGNSYFNGGNVGIGTISPGEKLEVVGNVKATAFVSTSDRRLKRDIASIDDPLERVLRLTGKTYRWKASGQADIGLIAQNVEENFPELVATDQNGIKAVKYGNVVAPVIEALKEFWERFTADSAEKSREIGALKAENAELRSRLERLEKLVEAQQHSKEQ